jgi:gamma-butyrobetaine dioxygenase
MTESAVRVSDKGLFAPLAEGETYFNYHWLRDACPSAIDPQTRERIFDISSLDSGPQARTAHVEDGALVIDWANEVHQTRLPLAQLQAFADNGRKFDPADLPRNLWYSGQYDSFKRVRQADAVSTDEGRAALARALVKDGVALVTEMENSDDSLKRLVNCLGPVTPSAEGDHFEVRLEIEPTNLAFTAGPLEMHTDLPGEEMAPGVQFLHCRENTVEGGLSLFLDGAAVAAALREEDPDAFAMLASHDIPFFYRHDGWDYRAHQRVIELDARGDVAGVTLSQHLQDDIDLPQDLLDDYYPALCKFIRMMQEDRFLCRFRLNAGECIVFDNHRIVHGREAFSAESGTRHLRGCYTDRGATWSTYRTLAAKGLTGTQTPQLKAA